MNYLLELTRGELANWQAPGFNKPQRSGLIRTCPDWSTGSKPLEDVTLVGVSHSILIRALRGILKRIIATAKDRRIRRRLAYIEHKHRSHRFFASIHAAFVWRSAQGNSIVGHGSRPGHCARPDTPKSPGHFRRPLEAALVTSVPTAPFHPIPPIAWRRVSR